MKIAVCLSGEPRTWKKCAQSTRHFFESSGIDEITYFGHTWGRNQWKEYKIGNPEIFLSDEHLDLRKLRDELTTVYPFAGLKIDPMYVVDHSHNRQEIIKQEAHGFEQAANYVRPSTWVSMSYSKMIANHLKYKYEVENNMKFDLVVSTRFDQCYSPTRQFRHYVKPHQIRPGYLGCEVGHFPTEFMQQSINDVLYFGNSATMDIVDSFYRIYHNGDFFKLVNANYYDPAYKNVGYGVLMYKWLTQKNIYAADVGRFDVGIMRRNSKILNPMLEFEALMSENIYWGKV